MFLILLSVFSVLIFSEAQSIQNFGSSGGSGPKGGIGDASHPVLKPKAYITDARIPLNPNGNTTRRLARGRAPALIHGAPPQDDCVRRVVVDSLNGARQEMLGFGHAWTDSSVTVLNELEPDVFDQAMEDLFGQTGNNMGFMRHSIGSSDLSGVQYTYDDNGPSFNEGEPDYDLSHFSLGPYGTAMAETIARMGDYKSDVFLFGSPWSYPGWTKYNDLFIAPNLNVNGGGSYNILNNSFNTRYIPQMVQYFTKYIDAFQEHGVSVNGLTLMNEPLNYQGGYPCMFLDAADEAALLAQGLGEALRERSTKSLVYDHNTDQPAYPARAIQGAGGYADAVAWHCYQSPVANYSVMDDFHHAFPNVPQFMTECSNYLPQAGSINFEVASNFIPPVQHGASGAAMWVMATDTSYGPHSPYGGCAGCLGSIIVNSSTTYTKTTDYYMVGQFSRFVRRGAVNYNVMAGIEGSALTKQQFYIMAVKNPDSSWAVVFMNNLMSDQEVVLSFTSGGSVWQGIVPHATVTTWLLPGDGYAEYGSWNASSSIGNGSSCALSTSAASGSSGVPASATLEPVPDTTHTIPAT